MSVAVRRLRHLLACAGLAVVMLATSAGSAVPTVRAANAPLGPGQGNPYLTSQVYGYLPYWMIDASTDGYLRYGLLSTIALHSISYDSTTGHVVQSSPGYQAFASSTVATIVGHAHAAGVRVDVSVSFPASADTNHAFFASPTATSTAIAETVATLGSWGLDGVSLDVEVLYNTDFAAYASFVSALRSAVRAANPAGQVSVASNANTSGARIAQMTLAAGADRAFMMGYDYRTGGSSPTGAVSPLTSFDGSLDLVDSINLYASAGAPLGRVVLGLPYYGRLWATVDDTLHSARNTAVAGCPFGPSSGTPTVAQIPGLATGVTPAVDTVEQTGWFARQGTGTWCEAYYDTPATLTAKYRLAVSRGMAGVGMWALGYDEGLTGYWDALAATFSLPPGSYHPVTPARIVDSRIGQGLGGPLASGVPATFQVSGLGGVPAGASAVT
ncbi:MAG TPA: glycoside hydrolase family 18 protein, partial [Candidatus Limnocylindrales bacterium]